ncbi:hypothetical protein [Nocardia sp. NPDC050710]|uniref:hypothetical protein n=1 Tax=Nocardia sp. NPDC050710 TaxID=3157220 RepID=UPI00340D9AFD
MYSEPLQRFVAIPPQRWLPARPGLGDLHPDAELTGMRMGTVSALMIAAQLPPGTRARVG